MEKVDTSENEVIQLHDGRLIASNLPYTIEEEDLFSIFYPYEPNCISIRRYLHLLIV